MVYVLIALVPASDPTQFQVLQEMTITNDGTGDVHEGNYHVKLSHSTTLTGKDRGFTGGNLTPTPGDVWRTGIVRGFRRSLSPATLVLRALKSALGEK